MFRVKVPREMTSSFSVTRNRLEELVSQFVESVQPSSSRVQRNVEKLRRNKPNLNNLALAESWAERVCRSYAVEGAASSLPSIIPGLGTGAQIAIEGSTVAMDLTYMLHCMADIVMGVGHIFGREIERPFNEEFVTVLGLWCGAITLGKETALRVGVKIAAATVRQLPEGIARQLPRHVGIKILNRFGLRRGTVSMARLIPFGVGVCVGGGFNYAAMRSFKNTAIKYYSTAIFAD